MSEAHGPAALLAAPTEPQQRLIEIVGGVYAHEPGTWPTFHYVQWMLDQEGIEAQETLQSFPSFPARGWTYSAVWSEAGPIPGNWARPEHTIALTVVGMSHCVALRKFPPSFSVPEIDLGRAFIDLLVFAAQRRRQEPPPSPTEVPILEVPGHEFIDAMRAQGHNFDKLPERLFYDIMEREPPLRLGGSMSVDGAWTRILDRTLIDFEGVTTLDEYLVRLAAQNPPPPRAPLATPSPLELVTAMDYLDTVWQLFDAGKHLFQHASAERTAKLSHAAQTPDELTARLSALGEVIRDARTVIPKPRAKDTPQRPLRSLECYLIHKLGVNSEARIQAAVHMLENVLFVRDHGQHTAAGTRAAAALDELGIGFPIVGWVAAWEAIQAATIEALGAIREELQAHLSSQTMV